MIVKNKFTSKVRTTKLMFGKKNLNADNVQQN